MRTFYDIVQMAEQDTSIGLTAHYNPLAKLINDKNYKSVIEIGTAYAGNAFHLLTHTDINSIVCIDPYLYYPAMPGFTCQGEYDTLFEFAKFRLLPSLKQVYFIRKTSREAINELGPVDLIFLDGSHEYEDVKWECENYSKLVKPGGVLSGHDYDIFEGVNKAVNEVFGNKVNVLPGNIWYVNF